MGTGGTCRVKKIHDPATSSGRDRGGCRFRTFLAGGTSYRTFEHPHVPPPKGIAAFRIQRKVRNIVNLSLARGSRRDNLTSVAIALQAVRLLPIRLVICTRPRKHVSADSRNFTMRQRRARRDRVYFCYVFFAAPRLFIF